MMIWKQEEVIIAWETNTQFYGRTRNFKEVFFDKVSCVSLWDTVKVEITWVNRWVLVGEIVWEKWIFS
jgi:tRNA A37 methylthiotransferase MiaB